MILQKIILNTKGLYFNNTMKIRLLLLIVFLSSCSPRINEVWKTQYIEKEILKDTIVYLEVPKEKLVTVVKDTISILENKYSESTAFIDSSGFLNHSLITNYQNIPFKVTYKDRFIYKSDTITIIKPVKGDVIIKEVAPKWSWYTLVLIILIIALYIRFKVKNKKLI